MRKVKVAIWDKWFKKEKDTKKKPASLLEQKQKKQKQVKIDSSQDIDKLMELIKSSLLIGKTDEKFQTIIDNIAWLRNNVAKQQTLEKVADECAKESTLKEIDKRLFYLIADKLSDGERKAFGKDTGGHVIKDIPKEVKRIAKDVDEAVERTIIRNSQNKILEVLKDKGELSFGNDSKTKGLTKYTGLNRSWTYKAVYLGWDSSGSPKKPQKDTLAGKGLVEVDTEKRPFRVKLRK